MAEGAARRSGHQSLDSPSLEALLDLWRDVLGAPLVAPDTHFYLAGGDSLQWARLLVRLRERWGWSLGDLLTAQVSTPLRMWEYCSHLPCCTVSAGSESGALDPLQPFPLGPMSRALWFSEFLSDGKGLYRCTLRIEWQGLLDVAALRGALAWVCARHPLLASVVAFEARTQTLWLQPGSRTVQLDTDGQLLEPDGMVLDWQRQLFGLALQQDDAGRHLVSLWCHHLLFDGWSGTVLLRDLLHAYAALTAKQDLPPPIADVAFAHFCWRQRQLSQPSTHQQVLPWWRHTLPGCQPLALATAAGPYAVQWQRALLAPAWWLGIKTLAAEQGVSPFAVLLAVFRLALWQVWPVTGDLISFPTANRLPAEEHSVGCFMELRLLPVHWPALGEAACASPAAVREWLQQSLPLVMQQLQQVEQYPIAVPSLVETMGSEPMPSGNHFTDAVLALQNFPAPDLTAPGATLTPRWEAPALGQYPLRLDVLPSSQAVELRCEFAPDCLPAERVDALLDFLTQLPALWR